MSTFWKCCNGNYPAHEKSCDNAPPSPLDELAQAMLDGRVWLRSPYGYGVLMNHPDHPLEFQIVVEKLKAGE